MRPVRHVIPANLDVRWLGLFFDAPLVAGDDVACCTDGYSQAKADEPHLRAKAARR